jgi:hypothetical protein
MDFLFECIGIVPLAEDLELASRLHRDRSMPDCGIDRSFFTISRHVMIRVLLSLL